MIEQLGPTKKFVDGLVRQYHVPEKFPAIMCIQEAVQDHTDRLAAVLNNSSSRMFNDQVTTQFERVVFNSSGPEGIAVIADKSRVGKPINLTPPIAENGCMGVSGRAYQIVFFPAIGSLIVNLHGPNPAVEGDRNQIIQMSGQNPVYSNNCHAIALENWLNETLANVNINFVVQRVILAGDFNDAMPLYFENQLFLHQSLPLTVRLGRHEFKVKLPMSYRIDSYRNQVPMPPPVTCCQYALDKKTRLPGDYVMSSCPSQSPLYVIFDTQNVDMIKHGLQLNDGMSEIDYQKVTRNFEVNVDSDRFKSDNIRYGNEFDAIAKGRVASALAWYVNDTYALSEPVTKMYSDHLAVAAHFGSMNISICSFNISFMFSDMSYQNMPFPSERLAWGIASTKH